jgi:hypothetical protein
MIEELPEFEIQNVEELKEFFDSHRLQISMLTFEAIKRALNEDLTYMPVMKIKVHDLPLAVITVKRENFDDSLNKCLKNFQEAELYEKCAEIVELLKDERVS